MKSRFVFLLLVFTVCTLSGCGAGHNARMDVDFSASDAAQTAESGAVRGVRKMAGNAGTLHMLGATPTNTAGIKVGYDETDVMVRHRVSMFAEAEERGDFCPRQPAHERPGGQFAG